jgi:UDP-N-acetylmuramate dehydrogenase
MIAITGLIGSGKSLVSSIVREVGFDVLNADAFVHELYKKNADLRKKIIDAFGDEAIAESGINRHYISQIVFSDRQKLELLESIVYPILQGEIEKINPQFLEAAVLYKMPEMMKNMEEVWVVEARESVRKERLLQRGTSEGDDEGRMRVQRIENGEWRIENNGSVDELRGRVFRVLDVPDGVKTGVSLREYNTFKIGGVARFFAEPRSLEEVQRLLAWSKRFGLEYFVLGHGSNVLFDDDGYNGLVIKGRFEAGNGLHWLIQQAANQGLGGLEKLEGIPGTVGGAVYMNAGAHGQQISDCVKSVTSVKPNGEIITRTKEECEFSYRSSIFKNANEIILSAEFNFTPMDKEAISKNRKEVLAWRLEKQPLQLPNAGSIFKNPPASQSAGALIEDCGLKGYRIGDAEVSLLHANFIVNKGNATAKDVRALMEKIIFEVKKKHSVELEAECFCSKVV